MRNGYVPILLPIKWHDIEEVARQRLILPEIARRARQRPPTRTKVSILPARRVMVVTNEVVIDLDLAHHTFPTLRWKTLKPSLRTWYCISSFPSAYARASVIHGLDSLVRILFPFLFFCSSTRTGAKSYDRFHLHTSLLGL